MKVERRHTCGLRRASVIKIQLVLKATKPPLLVSGTFSVKVSTRNILSARPRGGCESLGVSWPLSFSTLSLASLGTPPRGPGQAGGRGHLEEGMSPRQGRRLGDS